MLQEADDLLAGEGIESIDLTAGEERTDDLEAGVLRRGADERDDTLLHGRQEGVLLALAEAMDFVDEEDGAYRRAEDPALLTLDALQHLAHILDTRVDGTQRVEGGVEAAGDDLRERRLTHSWRAPEDQRREALLLDHRA